MTQWFTSDLHLGHAKIAEDRGFATVEEHDAAVLDSLHGTQKGDIIWILGDLAISKRDWRRALHLIGKLGRRVRLVLGNHDPAHPMHRGYLAPHQLAQTVFEWVGTEAVVRIDGQRWRVSHFPRSGPGSDHTDDERHPTWRPTASHVIHGHTHLADQRWHDGAAGVHQVHVGWDAWRRLVSEREIAEVDRG